mmetsp:Transcript_764/g.1685  ORF Transcript_764/g.1685 Transcript_764/m.1685 type:complete len:428 (+) Transcript_764:186-1469(+)
METTFTAIAPGRLCLFGEHQDYLGLPVIALALPLLCCKIDVVVTVTDDDNNTRDSADDTIIIHLHLPEVLGGETREYYLDDLPPSPPRTQEEGEDYDFALAAIHEVLKEEELKGLNGIDKISVRGEEKRKQKVYVRCKSFIGDLPLRAGCSSSTAFVTAFVLVLQRIFKDQRNRQLRTSTTPSINSNGDKNDNGCDGNSAGDRDGDGDGDGDSDSDGGRETQKNKKRLIEIKSEIELPFSAEVAYDAYSDLSRQASWSSWLESVEVVGNQNDGDGDDGSNNASKVESLWTSKMFGIRYSWTAVAVKNERPHTIRWKSVTGLRNEGIVRFYKKEGNAYNQGPTLMTLRMAFVAPRAVSAMIRRSKKLSNYVEEKMIAQSLEGFRDIVLECDTKNDSNDDDDDINNKKANTDTHANDLQEATISTAMSE